ncbi:methyl transferase, partial [Thelonectria olida]
GDFRREKYIFPIDEEEKNRLDIFHKFFLVARDNNLFSAPLDVKQALRVLDLGTGTGIWAIELSEYVLSLDERFRRRGLDFNMIQPEMIPPTMNPPQSFDIEGSWDTIDRDWDFIRAQMLFGSIQCWREMYQKMFMHLKPGIGYMEQVEIDWVPRCDDGTLPTDSALGEWASKLLKSLDRHGRSMRVDPEETRRQLALAGFTDIDETVIKVCYCPWSEDRHERQVGRWFNIGLSQGLTALSCFPMRRMLGMSQKDVKDLCLKAKRDMCDLRYHAYCRVYIWTARKPDLEPSTKEPVSARGYDAEKVPVLSREPSSTWI